MLRRFPALFLFATAALLAAAVAASAGTPPSARPSIAYRPAPVMAAGPHPDRQIEMLSRKIGQMLMIGFAGTRPEDPWPRKVAAMVGAGTIGGVILFADNIRGPAQVRALTAALARAGGASPPFIAIDQEGAASSA